MLTEIDANYSKQNREVIWLLPYFKQTCYGDDQNVFWRDIAN